MSQTLAPRPSYLRTISSQSSTSTTSSTSTSNALTPTTSLTPLPTPRKNKPRLYIALYPRGNTTTSFHTSCNCDSYHWSLVVGPHSSHRSDPGTRYHLSHSPSPSTSTKPALLQYEESDILSSHAASEVLIRVTVAKVRSPTHLQAVLRQIPIPSPQDDPSYTCLSWVRSAFTTLHSSASSLSSSSPGIKRCLKTYLSADDWRDIEACARSYCKRKREAGRFARPSIAWDVERVSTYNYWENREITA